MEINWEEVLAVERDGLDEDDESYWIPQILDFDPESEESRERLVSLFKVARAVLAAKVAEADAAREDFQKISSRLSETSEREKDLLEKIQKLRRQVEDTTPEGRDQFWRQEVVSFEMQLEEAEEKLREAQNQVALFKKRNEKLQRRADIAEAECIDYKREIAVLKDELSECHRALDKERSPGSVPEDGEGLGRTPSWLGSDEADTGNAEDSVAGGITGSMRLTSLLREKNELIEQLHAEMEDLKEENAQLEERTVELRNNLRDATSGLEEMTDELLRLKDALDESQALLTSVEEEKQNLASMVERSSKDQNFERKAEIEDVFSTQIEEMKAVIAEKDELIAELNTRMEAVAPLEGPDRQTFSSLIETLKEKDLQLMEMRKKLALAVEEMEATSKLLELSLDDRPGHNKSAEIIMEMNQKLEATESRAKRLERSLQDAEDHARIKDRQLAEVVARTREYLMGEYGLSDAITDIKDLKRDLDVRDKHVESLIQELNAADMNMAEVMEENETFRRKLGLKPSEKFAKYQDHKIVIKKLEKRVDELKTANDTLQAKLENTSGELSETRLALKNALAAATVMSDKAVASKTGAGGRRTSVVKDVLDPRTRKEFESALEELRGENVFLRQGLNEVLAALREHDGLSDVRLECPSLEKVLRQLEIRAHLGHPCPPLGLRVQMEKTEGVNSQLRDELRLARKAAREAPSTFPSHRGITWDSVTHAELLFHGEKEKLKGELAKFFGSDDVPINSDTSTKLVTLLHRTFDEMETRNNAFTACEKEAESLKKKVSLLKHQLGALYAERSAEKKSWVEEKVRLTDEVDNAELEIQSLKAQLAEYKNHFAVVDCSEEEIKTFLSESARKAAAARAAEVTKDRQLASSERRFVQLQEEKEALVEEALGFEKRAQERIDFLERFKTKAAFKLKAMQKILDSCVPRDSLNDAQREMRKMAAELQRALRRKADLLSELKNVALLEVETKHLHNANERLIKELEDAKSQLSIMEISSPRRGGNAVVESGRQEGDHDLKYQVELLTRKLAVSELRERNERERSQHSSKLYKTLQSHCEYLESRNGELERALDELSSRVSDQERMEAEMREELMSAVRRKDYEELVSRLATVEGELMSTKDECQKLEQVATIAQCELEAREKLRDESKLENKMLKKTVCDLGSTSDANAKIGSLMDELLSKEKKLLHETAEVRRLKTMLAECEGQKMVLEAKLDEVDDRELKLRDFYQAKITRCEGVLRRVQEVFAGSLPLRAQVHLSDMIMKVQEEKVKLAVMVKEAQENQRKYAEQLEQLKISQVESRDSQQLPSSAVETNIKMKTLSWKVERLEAELRKLRELKEQAEASVDELQSELIEAHRLSSATWNFGEIFQRDGVPAPVNVPVAGAMAQPREVTEEQILRTTKQSLTLHEEARLKIVLRSSSTQTEAVEGESQQSLPTANVPDTAPLGSLKEKQEQAAAAKARLLEVELKVELLEKENEGLRDVIERQRTDSLEREKALTELRLKALSSTPSSRTTALERELLNTAMAAVTSSGAWNDDMASQTLIKVAQNTIVSLQKRIAQKEEMVERLSRLLKETRDESREMARLHTLELEKVHKTIHKLQERAVERLKSALAGGKENEKPLTITLDEKEFRELENKAFEQNRNIGNLKEQLETSKRELSHWKKMADNRGKEADVVQTRLTQTYQIEMKTLKEEINRLQRELQNAVEERMGLETALEAMESAARGPRGIDPGSSSMGSFLRDHKRGSSFHEPVGPISRDPSVSAPALKTLVASLRQQLNEKERQQAALAGALAELKAEVTKRNGDGRKGSAGMKLSEADEISQVKMSNLWRKLSDAKEALKKSKESEAAARSELEEMKKTVEAKSKALLQVSEARNAMQKKVIQLQSRSPTVHEGQIGRRQEGAKSAKEVELQMEVGRLQKSLKDSEDMLKVTRLERDKAAKHAEELAKWGEKKKWEKKIIQMQSKLKEKDGRLEALERADKGMRELLKRMEKRLAVMQSKRGQQVVPIASSEGDSLRTSPVAREDDELEQLRGEVRDMQEQCLQLSKALNDAGVASEMDKQMEERLAKLKADLAKAREDHLQTKLALQEARLEIVRLNEEKKMLELDAEVKKSVPKTTSRKLSFATERRAGSASSNDRRSSLVVSKKSTPLADANDAEANLKVDQQESCGQESATIIIDLEVSRKRISELERTVSALRRIIETLEREKKQKNMIETRLHGASPAPSGDISIGSENRETVKQALRKLVAERDALMLELRAKNAEIENLTRELQDARLQRRVALEEMENVKRKLDRVLSSSGSSGAKTEYLEIRMRALEEELAEKKGLLMRVKILLKDAASREKELIAHQDALRLRVAELESRR